MEYTNPLTLNTSLQYPQGILRSKVEKEWVTVTLQANIEESNINKNKPSSDIVFVIDKSGSMKSDKKMAFVQSTIEYYIRELDSKHRIGILLFNSEIENLTDSFELNDDGLIQLTEENKTKLLDILPNIKPEGGTNMSYALETAVKLLHERKKSKPLSYYFILY